MREPGMATIICTQPALFIMGCNQHTKPFRIILRASISAASLIQSLPLHVPIFWPDGLTTDLALFTLAFHLKYVKTSDSDLLHVYMCPARQRTLHHPEQTVKWLYMWYKQFNHKINIFVVGSNLKWLGLPNTHLWQFCKCIISSVKTHAVNEHFATFHLL
jgi:hypothetical protein